MNQHKKYTNAPGLRTALEQRLIRIAGESHLDLDRLRRHVAFDRFLARLFFKTD